MPLIILGVIVIICLSVYVLLTEHREWFVREKKKSNDPFNVIYLPEDLEEEKKRRRHK